MKTEFLCVSVVSPETARSQNLSRSYWQLTLALWLIALIPGLTQTTSEAWVRYYGNGVGVYDYGQAIGVDPNGNVIVTGVIVTGPSASDTSGATIKYSSAGVPLWTNRCDSGSVAMAVDASGSVFVTGSDGDYATYAYSSAGVPLWTNRYRPGNSWDSPGAIAVDSNGNVLVSGVSSSSGWSTIKYSGAGTPLWTNLYVGGAGDFPAMAVSSQGDVVVAGFSSGANDFVTIKYSPAGVSLWTGLYDGPESGADFARAVAVDESGNVFVMGESRNGLLGDYSYVLIKYSSSGLGLWTNRYDDSVARGVCTMAVDGSGNAVVSGRSYHGGHSYETIKFSGSGLSLWTNRFMAGNGDESQPVLAVDQRGNVFVTGPVVSGTLTVAYSALGVPLWTNAHNGAYSQGLAVDSLGNVFVTGYTIVGSPDYVTIKYPRASTQPIPLNLQVFGSQLVLSWTNSAFGLQAAPAAQGDYSNIVGASSPFTNPIFGPQRYFRLKAD